jgi:xanthine dehydrogenase YagS FAD-binding subunit
VDVRRENVLARDEFLKSVFVPAQKPGRKGTYVKLKERETWDFALVSAAVGGVLAGGAFSEIAIVMGGVAPVPWRLKKAEDAIRGQTASEDLVDQAAEAALAEAVPLAENAYKIDLVKAALRTAVARLLQSG